MSTPDFREALGAVIHAKGWPDPVTMPLRPDTCDACVESLRIADAILALLAERLGGDEVREVVAEAILAEHEPGFANVKGSRLADTLRSQFREAADAALAALRDHLGVTR